MRWLRPRWQVVAANPLLPYSTVHRRFWLRRNAELEAGLCNQRALFCRYSVEATND